ncbi:MAG TPA: amino acid permease [Solirubrobacterales bacterium]|nr:amino acid permease [Solirubrobacterales bacterium]
MESGSVTIHDSDEKRLAELGYKQSLNRAWSGFSNFAISFTIISILAGCFTTYGQAWNNGGPIAISIGWPLISIPILIIGFCMSELVSAYPTAGGIYWWAGRLGGPVWAWFTGWFNLIGLIAVVASVDYAAATFLNVVLGLYEVNIFGINFGDESHVLAEVFLLFVLILLVHVFLNVRNTHLLARINNVSVWWHVLGVAAIVLVLIFVPDGHQSFSFVFGHRINQSGFSDSMFWFYVLPLGFLLTQYTITGFDASAHISEETHGASTAAAKGVWRSIFYSAVIGWIVLLAITFSVTNVEGANEAFGFAPTLLVEALGSGWGKFVLIISVVGQLFCGAACLTSASRMCYAFSRDNGFGKRASSRLSTVNTKRVPVYAVLLMAALALIITLPALKGKSNGEAVPFAFFAVVSITVIGLYIAYVIPIFLRWRKGAAFQTGPWNNGRKYKWMNSFATIWVIIITIIFCLPFTPEAVPWNSEFTWEAFNYAPLTVGIVILGAAITWLATARHHFTGQIREIEIEEVLGENPDPQTSAP